MQKVDVYRDKKKKKKKEMWFCRKKKHIQTNNESQHKTSLVTLA